MGKPPATLERDGQLYRRVSLLSGTDGQLHGIYRPERFVALSTADWIGKPSKQDIEFFLWCMFQTVAGRSAGRSKHQNEQISGPFITYGKSKGQRESDFVQRIYAAVRLLELSGESNWEACCEVANSVQPRLGTTNRGRPRKALRAREFLDHVNNVRGLFNSYKPHHPFPEKLPNRDTELESWWGHFLDLRKWAVELLWGDFAMKRIALPKMAVLMLKAGERIYCKKGSSIPFTVRDRRFPQSTRGPRRHRVRRAREAE